MKNIILKFRLILYYISTALIFSLGYAYEKPFGVRKYVLFVLILSYLVTIVGMNFVRKSKGIIVFSLMATVVLLITEFFSKYAMNYFIHSVYLLLLMYLVFFVNQRSGIWLSSVLMIASSVKFMELLKIQPNQANLSMAVFFISIQILMLLVFYFSKRYWQENNKSRGLYNELLETHRKLKNSADELKQLTMVEERSKIARDLHDTLGHELTGLIMQMEMATRFLEQDEIDKGKDILADAKVSARGSLGRVRRIVNTLKDDEELEWSSTTIQTLAKDFSDKTGTEIICNIQSEKSIHPEIGIAIYRIIQEALTNSVRHGKATSIQVDVRYGEEEIAFTIRDNGKGCKDLHQGNGLKGMQERLTDLKGEIFFDGRFGFIVEGKIPY